MNGAFSRDDCLANNDLSKTSGTLHDVEIKVAGVCTCLTSSGRSMSERRVRLESIPFNKISIVSIGDIDG